jgi:hypothetical protein
MVARRRHCFVGEGGGDGGLSFFTVLATRVDTVLCSIAYIVLCMDLSLS